VAKSLLIISRQAPWSGPDAREALDIALAGGAFDLPMGMLFMDDGVLQLATAQNAGQVQQKDLTANLQALSMFGVEDLFACGTSLNQRGMQPTALSVEPLEVLDDLQIADLIDRYDQVITI
jgi:tRNA 2-thiouridine synthesizing protein C